MSGTFAYAYNRTNSLVFLAENMRNALRDIILEAGLNPDALLTAWEAWVRIAVRTWAESGHLRTIVIEFYRPGANLVTTRWDFPIRYSGSGVDDDMWLDKAYLRQLIAKAPKPSRDCIYDISLQAAAGRPSVPGVNMVDSAFKSTGNLTPRAAGTVIATAHLTATATYWV